MKTLTFLFAIGFCLFLFSTCQQEKKQENSLEYQAEIAEILAQNIQKYLEAWKNDDLEKCLSFYDKDFLNMFSYGPDQNIEECRESFKNVFDDYSIEDVKLEKMKTLTFAFAIVLLATATLNAFEK